jgi:hypothetical protein
MAKKILFLTAELPSFARPLTRNAGLLSELATRHQILLAYPQKDQLNETDRKIAAEICDKLLEFQTNGSLENSRLKQALEEFQSEIVQVDNPELAQLLKPLVPGVAENGWLILHPEKLEAGGQFYPFGPGIDTGYWKRQTPINITSKLFLFSIRAEHQNFAIAITALRYLLKHSWPEVRQRQPEARLKVVVEGQPEDLPPDLTGGDSWQLDYGTISPQEYETGRLALAPYLTNTPGNVQPWLEAWAMQLPLLTLPAAAKRLSVMGARLGDHFLKGEDGPSLAALMGRLLEIRRPGLHLAEAGRILVEEQFSWMALAKNLEKFYDRL